MTTKKTSIFRHPTVAAWIKRLHPLDAKAVRFFHKHLWEQPDSDSRPLFVLALAEMDTDPWAPEPGYVTPDFVFSSKPFRDGFAYSHCSRQPIYWLIWLFRLVHSRVVLKLLLDNTTVTGEMDLERIGNPVVVEDWTTLVPEDYEQMRSKGAPLPEIFKKLNKLQTARLNEINMPLKVFRTDPKAGAPIDEIARPSHLPEWRRRHEAHQAELKALSERYE